MEYELNNNKYIIKKDDHNIFDYNVIKEMVTDYFSDYDYILGDMAYNKIRLKGFCDKKNKNFNKINDIKSLDSYLENYCSYNCKWFLLEKKK